MCTEVNSADIQFLLGIGRREAEKIIRKALNDKEMKIKPSTLIKVSDIKECLISVYEQMDGKNPVQNAIDLIQKYGIPYSLRKQIYEDMKCLAKGDLVGRYRTLKKILSEDEISKIKKHCLKERMIFLCSGGRFPKGCNT